MAQHLALVMAVAISLEDRPHPHSLPEMRIWEQLSPWTLLRGASPKSPSPPQISPKDGAAGLAPHGGRCLSVSLGSSPTSFGPKPCGTLGTRSGMRLSSITASRTRTCREKPSGTRWTGGRRRLGAPSHSTTSPRGLSFPFCCYKKPIRIPGRNVWKYRQVKLLTS